MVALERVAIESRVNVGSTKHVDHSEVTIDVDHAVAKTEKVSMVQTKCFFFFFIIISALFKLYVLSFFFWYIVLILIENKVMKAVTLMAAKLMAKMGIVNDDPAVETSVDHASHVLAKTMPKEEILMVAKAMKTDNKKVADHHAKDAITANQKPADPIR